MIYLNIIENTLRELRQAGTDNVADWIALSQAEHAQDQVAVLIKIQNTLKLIAFILGIIATVAFMLWLAKVD